MMALRRFYISTAVALLLTGHSVVADAASTCANTQNVDDQAIWGANPCDQASKNWFTAFYGIHKVDWDEGWGWIQCDPAFEFPKMWNAVVLLAGIDHTIVGRWKIDNIIPTPPGVSLWESSGSLPSQPALRVRADGFAEVFVRSRGGQLFHFRYDTKQVNPPVTVTNLTSTAANPRSAQLTFPGPVAILSRPGEPLAVLGMSDSQPGFMVVFHEVTGGGWVALPVGAGSADLLVNTPAVVKSPSGATFLLGVNSNGRVIQYTLNTAYDVTAVEMSSYITPAWRASKSPGSLSATLTGTRLEVFVPRDPDGKILYFRRDIGGGSWQAQNLTDSMNSAPPVTPTTPLALVQRGGPNLTLFARNSRGELIRYARDEECTLRLAALGCVQRGEVWRAQNISQIAVLDISPPPGQSWSIDTTMREGPYAALAPDGTERVFGLGPGLFASTYNYVKYFYQQPGMLNQWRKTDLTMNTTGGNQGLIQTVVINYVAGVVSGGDGVRFYGNSPKGRLVRYRCRVNAGSCSSEYVGNSDFTVLELHNGLQPSASLSPAQSDHAVGINTGAASLRHYQFIADHSWHASVDYENWASGYLHDFHYEPRNSSPSDKIAEAQWGPWPDEVHFFCQMFDGSETAASRASTMLHEANHITQHVDHDSNNRDPFFEHGLGAIPAGSLNANNANHKHSSYQIEIEFLADLAEFSGDSMPLIVTITAESIANSLLNNRINNNPGWRVGLPRPL